MALFLHKPLFLNAPDDPELGTTAIRYVPLPARRRLIEMFATVDLRLVASGHVHQRRDFTYRRHPPRLGALRRLHHSRRSGRSGSASRRSGLVEYRFQPDSFEVRHVRAPGQVDVDLDALLGE